MCVKNVSILKVLIRDTLCTGDMNVGISMSGKLSKCSENGKTKRKLSDIDIVEQLSHIPMHQYSFPEDCVNRLIKRAVDSVKLLFFQKISKRKYIKRNIYILKVAQIEKQQFIFRNFFEQFNYQCYFLRQIILNIIFILFIYSIQHIAYIISV